MNDMLSCLHLVQAIFRLFPLVLGQSKTPTGSAGVLMRFLMFIEMFF